MWSQWGIIKLFLWVTSGHERHFLTCYRGHFSPADIYFFMFMKTCYFDILIVSRTYETHHHDFLVNDTENEYRGIHFIPICTRFTFLAYC
jgi:hypothetical protein